MWSGLGAALVGGGLSVGGSLLGGLLNAEYAGEAADVAWARQLEAARIAFERQKELMRLQMDYNSDMSSSAHQRQVLDLKLAGLNPILSSNLGGASYSGVSAPSVSTGSSPQASAVDFGDLGFGKAGELIGKSSAMRLAGEQAKQVKANNESQRALNAANASSAKAQAALQSEQIETEKARQKLYNAQAEDAQNTHLYKFPGLINKNIQRYLQSKFEIRARLEPEKSRFRVYPEGEVIDNNLVPTYEMNGFCR